jgi:hypothetical protein
MPGNTRRDSFSEQTSRHGAAGVSPRRAPSAFRNFSSKLALWADSASAPMKSISSGTTFGRRRAVDHLWVMPVSEVMKDGMRTPQFTSET